MHRFVEACHHTRTILPATTTTERICADALVDAERRVEGPHRRAGPARASAQTSSICSKRRSTPGVTRFVWLRQFEPGSNSAYANRLLDRLEIPAEFLAHVSPLG